MNEFQNHYSRGMVLYEQRRYDLAEKEFGLAVAADVQSSDAHAMLGMALYQQGWLLKAKKEAEEAIRLAPDDAYPHYALSCILMLGFTYDKKGWENLPMDIPRLVQNGSSVNSIRAAEEAVRIEPENPDFLGHLAELRVWSGKWHDGLEVVERALAQDPTHAGCLYVRAVALTGLRRKAEAAAAIERFVALHPDHPFAHKLLGQHKMEASPAAAQEHLLDSLRLDPHSKSAQRALGQARNLEFIRARNNRAAQEKPVAGNEPVQPGRTSETPVASASSIPADFTCAQRTPAGIPDSPVPALKSSRSSAFSKKLLLLSVATLGILILMAFLLRALR